MTPSFIQRKSREDTIEWEVITQVSGRRPVIPLTKQGLVAVARAKSWNIRVFWLPYVLREHRPYVRVESRIRGIGGFG